MCDILPQHNMKTYCLKNVFLISTFPRDNLPRGHMTYCSVFRGVIVTGVGN